MKKSEYMLGFILTIPFTILQVVMSATSLWMAKDDRLSAFSLSTYDRSYIPETILVALCCTLFNGIPSKSKRKIYTIMS